MMWAASGPADTYCIVCRRASTIAKKAVANNSYSPSNVLTDCRHAITVRYKSEISQMGFFFGAMPPDGKVTFAADFIARCAAVCRYLIPTMRSIARLE